VRLPGILTGFVVLLKYFRQMLRQFLGKDHVASFQIPTYSPNMIIFPFHLTFITPAVETASLNNLRTN
jgi:hypothetical protein